MRVYLGGGVYDGGLVVDPDPLMWEDSGADYEVPDELVTAFLAAEQALEDAERAILQHLGYDSLRDFQDRRVERIQAFHEPS